ncbi:MAG: aspartate kinase [Gammaproteobacteria bacterium]|nr:aspartate kinase [Gammaproteobacteria bacterium]
MSVIVQKFGGTSVASVELIEHVATIVRDVLQQGHQVVVVVSAMGGETDRLLGLAQKVDAHYSGRELDALLATGEQGSAALLAIALNKQGVKAVSMTGWQAGMRTDRSHNKARIQAIDTDKINKHLEQGKVIVIAGFQGVDEHDNITTLGRGGSDTTAVAIAAKLKCEECRIYTDVDGIYTTDPRIEPKARRLDSITFEEMLEMASLGSKVLQIRSVELAGKYNVPLRVLSTFKEGLGTLISYEENSMEELRISGVASNQDEAQLTVRGVPDRAGVAASILEPIAAASIEVDMIVQNVGSRDGTADFTFTVHRRDYQKAMQIMETTVEKLGSGRVIGNDSIVKVSLVGAGMRSHAGVASKMFSALAQAGIDIRMISTSEIKISVVIKEEMMKKAVQVLHRTFELDRQ